MNIAETLIDIPAEHERNVFGQFDVFVKKIEQTLKVSEGRLPGFWSSC